MRDDPCPNRGKPTNKADDLWQGFTRCGSNTTYDWRSPYSDMTSPDIHGAGIYYLWKGIKAYEIYTM